MEAEVASPPASRGPRAWLWTACIIAQAGVAWLLLRFTYFYADDWLFMRQAQQQPLSLRYLCAGLFQHFSPISRLLDKLLVAVAPGSFALAHGIELAMYVIAILAFAWVVRAIVGSGWTALVMTIVFGQSVFLIRLLTWWTATANLLPATIGMLLCVGAYVRWVDTRRPLVAVAAWGGLFLALIDYETAMLLPVNLLVIRLVVMQDSWKPVAWFRTLWRERLMWIGLIGLDVLAFVNYEIVYYVPAKAPTFGEDLRFLLASAFESFIPALFGYKRYPTQPGASLVAVATVLFVLCIAGVLVRRRRAWRCVIALTFVFLLEMLPLGLNEISSFGVDVGTELYYQQSVQFLALILLAFAISPRWGGAHVGRRAGRLLRAVVDRRPGSLDPRRVAQAFIVTVLVLYGVDYVASARQIGTPGATPEPHQSRAYMTRFRDGVSRYVGTTGREPDLVNLNVPFGIVSTAFVPYDEYDQIFRLVEPRVVYDRWERPLFYVGSAGNLLQARTRVLARGRIDQSTVSDSLIGGTVVGGGSNRGVCTRGYREVQWIRIPLDRRPGHTDGDGLLAREVAVVYRSAAEASVTVTSGSPDGSQASADADPHVWTAGSGSELAMLDPGLDPSMISFALPGGVCVTRLAVLAVQSS